MNGVVCADAFNFLLNAVRTFSFDDSLEERTIVVYSHLYFLLFFNLISMHTIHEHNAESDLFFILRSRRLFSRAIWHPPIFR